eukprot:18589_1
MGVSTSDADAAQTSGTVHLSLWFKDKLYECSMMMPYRSTHYTCNSSEWTVRECQNNGAESKIMIDNGGTTNGVIISSIDVVTNINWFGVEQICIPQDSASPFYEEINHALYKLDDDICGTGYNHYSLFCVDMEPDHCGPGRQIIYLNSNSENKYITNAIWTDEKNMLTCDNEFVISFGIHTSADNNAGASNAIGLSLWFDDKQYECSVVPMLISTFYSCTESSWTMIQNQSNREYKIMVENSNSGDGIIIDYINITTNIAWYGIDQICIPQNAAVFENNYSPPKLDDDFCGVGYNHYTSFCVDFEVDDCAPGKQILYFDINLKNKFLTDALWKSGTATTSHSVTMCTFSNIQDCTMTEFNGAFCCYYLQADFNEFEDDSSHRSNLQQDDMLDTIRMIRDIGMIMFITDSILVVMATVLSIILYLRRRDSLKYVVCVSVFGTVIDICLTFISIGIITENDLIDEIENLYFHGCYTSSSLADILGVKEQFSQILILDALEASLDIVGLLFLCAGKFCDHDKFQFFAESIHGGLFGLDWILIVVNFFVFILPSYTNFVDIYNDNDSLCYELNRVEL